jgi:hypothetical protein
MAQQTNQEQARTHEDAAQSVITMIVVMAMTAAAFMVLLVVMVMAAAVFMVLLVVMMVTAAALVMLFMVMVMTTAAGFPVFMVVMMLPLPAGCLGGISGVDLHLSFHSPGDLHQFGNQRIRVSGGEPQLLGGEGDDGLLHLGVGIELCLDLGGAVGAVQIFDDVYLSGHREPSFDFDI